jgi:hypothetical protein
VEIYSLRVRGCRCYWRFQELWQSQCGGNPAASLSARVSDIRKQMNFWSQISSRKCLCYLWRGYSFACILVKCLLFCMPRDALILSGKDQIIVMAVLCFRFQNAVQNIYMAHNQPTNPGNSWIWCLKYWCSFQQLTFWKYYTHRFFSLDSAEMFLIVSSLNSFELWYFRIV